MKEIKQTIKYKTTPGQYITNACIETTRLAIKNQCDVELGFNDVKLIATKDKPSHHLEYEFMIIPHIK